MPLEKIISELESPEIKSKIGFSQGFYYLSGKEKNIARRKERYLIAEKKYKKVKRLAKYLACLPQVAGVAVSNTLAINNSRREADIDLFVIARAGKIWSARFWSIMPLYFFGKRPKPGATQDKYCFSYWVDANHLDIKPWKLEKDIYYIYWLATLMPVYDQIFHKFWLANDWVNYFLPNFDYPKPNRRYLVIKSLILPLPTLEKLFKKIQMLMMPDRLKLMSENQGSEVVINEGVLKFHPDDKRRYYQKIFNEKISPFDA